jgi:hypothetical protein
VSLQHDRKVSELGISLVHASVAILLLPASRLYWHQGLGELYLFHVVQHRLSLDQIVVALAGDAAHQVLVSYSRALVLLRGMIPAF